MRALPSDLRRQLENAVVNARRAADSASRAALEALGVFAERRPDHLDTEQAMLRNGLRAKMRQLGGEPELLISECAYEQWHRLLFARFLAENNLLLHPEFRAPVTLADCEELADELHEPDGWSVAARFAAEILPGIFRLDDPCVELRLAPEGRHALEEILAALPRDVFLADDALGWVYQFWQKEKKDEINASERKIGGADLGPVTQLFTENYMVRFLLENSLGAWWAGKHPDSPLLREFDYLRYDNEGEPAAGTFDGWPERVAEVTVMDPCCGSGHFLVEAFNMLWRMRSEEEGLSPVEAQDAVLRDNLFGLEIDPRCVQIAMFSVAVQAWRAGGGWRELPVPNIACSGIPVKAPVDEWRALAVGDERLANAIVRLHTLFREADTLGSLIDPKETIGAAAPPGSQRSFDDIEWESVVPVLRQRLAGEADDPAAGVLGSYIAGSARAADYLSRAFILICTNVPFLSFNRQAETLKRYVENHHHHARHDLAAAFLDRWWISGGAGNTTAVVGPSEWLFLVRYKSMRRRALETRSFELVVRLGMGAFTTTLRASPALLIGTADTPDHDQSVAGLDAEGESSPEGKATRCRTGPLTELSQSGQLSNPDVRILLAYEGRELEALSTYAVALEGVRTGDSPRFDRQFWEVADLGQTWERLQSSVDGVIPYGGRSKIIRWEGEQGDLAAFAESVKHLNHAAQNWRSGKPSWGRRGVAVSLMGDLLPTLYSGDRYDMNCCAVVPRAPGDLAALWAFAASGDLCTEVRKIDQSIKLTPKTLLKIPFDVERWRRVAEESGPLPEPWSDDPAQWLFEGRPEESTAPLQVAVARLLGYQWPEQPDSDDLDGFADADAIVCLPSVAGEDPASDRLQRLLAAAYGDEWSPSKAQRLIEETDSKKRNLADWLRDDFFKQHRALFGNRPFIWHIWDGQRDGFSALVNYHRLDRKNLEKLTYTYLGQDWVERQRAAARDEVAGADARLAAAQDLQRKLEAILEGEKPYDIYVRWKTIEEQPIGWEPDLNDGVRLNIRPFVEAGVLRSKFNIHWRKDRGKNPDGSERLNDLHLSLAEKREAHNQAGRT